MQESDLGQATSCTSQLWSSIPTKIQSTWPFSRLGHFEANKFTLMKQ